MKSMLSNLDVRQCVMHYSLNAPREEIIRLLDERPDFERDIEDEPPGSFQYSWLRKGESREFEMGISTALKSSDEDSFHGTIGKLRLEQDKVVIETFSRQKLEFAKRMIERYFGRKLTFLRELSRDMANELQRLLDDPEQDTEPEEADEIPPEVQQQLLQQFHDQHYRHFIDEPVPMLDGKTPRQASQIPSARPKLIELMKLHINGLDTRAKHDGMRLDISWVLDELGLEELRP